ncbi:MAG: hypothetical protein ACRC62_35810 [Microcoleus sp.]
MSRSKARSSAIYQIFRVGNSALVSADSRQLTLVKDRALIVNCQSVCCQLSIVNCQLSTLNYYSAPWGNNSRF